MILLSFNGIREQNTILFIVKLTIQHFIHFIGIAIMALPFVLRTFFCIKELCDLQNQREYFTQFNSFEIFHWILNMENNYHQKVNTDVWWWTLNDVWWTVVRFENNFSIHKSEDDP